MKPLLTCILTALLASHLAAADAAAPLGEARVYKTVGNRDLKLHIVRPDGWKATDRRSAIVFFHGGGWVNGKPTQFNDHSVYFASRGLVCIQVEYRLVKGTDKAPPLVCIQDARSSMRWVRSHAEELGINRARIASAGGSAGGHLAAHVGMVDLLDDPSDDKKVPAKSNAMLLFNPVLDNGPGGFGAKTIGDRYPEFSPAHNISRDDPPAILFLGSEDKLIPVATLKTFESKMQAAGIKCALHVYDGQGHGFFNAKNRKYYHLTVVEADRFLASLGWLNGPPTLQASPEAAQK
jgi:acetyl esterase/lipase